MQADLWCPLCGADRAIVAWCPKCAVALGVLPPMQGNASTTDGQDVSPNQDKAALGPSPTPFVSAPAGAALQSPSHKPPPKNLAPKIPAKKSGGPKVEPHAIKPSVLRHREKMREYMRRRRQANKSAKAWLAGADPGQPIDPNIVHPMNGPGPFPEENE